MLTEDLMFLRCTAQEHTSDEEVNVAQDDEGRR